jgi:hypothetical protein
MFDALHAYGLGILLACAIDAPIRLTDEGMVYRLHSPIRTKPHAAVDILDKVLPLPTLKDLAARRRNSDKMSLSLATLDGLLAALFTSPGARVLSVADLFKAQSPAGQPQVNLSAAQDGLRKVRTAITRWKDVPLARDAARHPSPSAWLESVLKDYDACSPTIPLPAPTTVGNACILMTLEPSYGYSTRRSLSGVMHKTGVMIVGAPYARLLAFVGAARFLRAHHVAGHQVNFYVPLAASMTLSSQTTLPTLPFTANTSDHALALQWLAYFSRQNPPNDEMRLPAEWTGLAYQVIQTRGVRQAISRQRGCLDYAWLVQVVRQTGNATLNFWKRMLGYSPGQAPLEVDHLVDCLTHHRVEDWLAHLRDVALALRRPGQCSVRAYHLHEMREITAMMDTPTKARLNGVLERQQGTLRFGYALRLLGHYTPGSLRDLIDNLEAVQTCDQLIRVLARAVQECVVAMARSPFIIIPTDEDLKYLLDDVDQYGPRTIAGLLIILSTLRYAQRRSPNKSAPPKSRRTTR